jgi:hypothetical protein
MSNCSFGLGGAKARDLVPCCHSCCSQFAMMVTHPSRCQHIDHAQTKWKPEIQPHRMVNHVGWKSMSTIKRITGKSGHVADPTF